MTAMTTTAHRRKRCIVLIGCIAMIAGATPGIDGAALAGCLTLPEQGEAVVAAIEDGRTLRLQDGREIRLAGIEIDPSRQAAAKATLASLARERRVTLRGDDDAPDRYGRQPAFVFAEAGTQSLQLRLLDAGEALVGLGIADGDCRAELLAAEATARVAQRGLWADPAALKNAGNPGDIMSRVGRFTVIEGRILSVRGTGGTIYLNFGRRWTRDFAVTISRRILGSFEAAGIAPKSLEKKRIRVRGWVERRSGPQIRIREVGQIEMPGAR
ncbi:thermonuclease family protein [Rhodopseudomonas sp. NSM]|uniref:thermonuclease family protein n=1 Tax=Rhodopseudomonas sp. NSM TaxID=3457630 RepID=UPI0040357496